jgi:predicted deacylase
MPSPHPAPPKHRLKQLVLSLWAINFACVLVVIVAWLATQTSALAFLTSPTQTASITDTPSPTLSPTLTQTPSVTPTPTDTLTPTETQTPSLTPTETRTPIPFSEGPIIIGYSVQGRPLEVYRFGTGPTEKLIVAGMHGGNEYNTVQLVDQLMAHILEHPEIIPADTTLYILHALNPDGIAKEKGPRGRANANSVDLNRNWPANWQKDWPREGCWTDTYVTGGTGPASEPETKALMTFIQNHKIAAIINYHSAALGIFPGGIPIAANSKRLAEALHAVTNYPYPPLNTGCHYTGGFVDWSSNQGIPSVDMELTDHTHTDFDKNLLALNVLLEFK